jgi:FeS assembly protein IscX
MSQKASRSRSPRVSDQGKEIGVNFGGAAMAKEISWEDSEEIGIQLQEKFSEIDPLTVRFTDLHKYVTELDGFSGDPARSNESKLEAIQMAWYEEYKDAQ